MNIDSILSPQWTPSFRLGVELYKLEFQFKDLPVSEAQEELQKKLQKLIAEHFHTSSQFIVVYLLGIGAILFGLFVCRDGLFYRNQTASNPQHFATLGWKPGYYQLEGLLIPTASKTVETDWIIGDIIYYHYPFVSVDSNEKIHLLVSFTQAWLDKSQKEYPFSKNQPFKFSARGIVKNKASSEVLQQLASQKLPLLDPVVLEQGHSLRNDWEGILIFSIIGISAITFIGFISWICRWNTKRQFRQIQEKFEILKTAKK